jgi:hypothetical protein
MTVDHNEEFIADPTGNLVAIIDGGDDAVSAEKDLVDAGFSEVHVYRGVDGAQTIDSTGTEHGPFGEVIRGVQQLFTNKDNLAEYEQAVREGHTVIAVKVDDGDARDRADDILERHGAHAVNHFGAAVVRTIKP